MNEGDVFTTDLDALLDGVSVVVSTLGGFGSNEQMEKINAEANILAVNAAKRSGVPRYIYISVHPYNLPTFALNNGYFSGKKKAEAEVLSLYPNSGEHTLFLLHISELVCVTFLHSIIDIF
jgi:hypothetical protein